MNRSRLVIALAILPAALFGDLFGETPLRSAVGAEPFLGAMRPQSVARGRTTRVTLVGSDLNKAFGLWTSAGPGVTAKRVTDSSKDVAAFDVRVAADAPLGLHGLRGATVDGLTNPVVFLIDDLPPQTLDPSASPPTVAQLPTAVAGFFRPTEIDRYAFEVKAGDEISFECVAGRFGKDADPLLRIRDARNRIVVEYDNFAWGAEAQFYTTPLISRDFNMLRAIYGVRYFYVTEEMTLSLFDTVIGSTVVQSDTRANMVGPELGLRWDLGGEKFKIYTVGKIGALGNFQRLDLVYNNWSGNTDHLREYHANVVPMLDLGIYSEFPLFRHLPIFKKIPHVRDGIFRFGWNYTGLFFMARPAEDIRYELAHPRLKINRTTFDIRQFHFGIDWKW